MLIYSKNTSIDGHPITKHGEPMNKEEIIKELNFLASTISSLKDTLWIESNRTTLASDSMDAAIERATAAIGK